MPVSTGRAERDVTQDLLGALVIKKPTHCAVISKPEELSGILLAVDGYSGIPEVNAVLRVTLILFQHPSEIRYMEWLEIDWEQAYWEIPADKIKMRLPS